eukprot:scaffold127521_cov36-Tisochrysis_lutea.AAC.1
MSLLSTASAAVRGRYLPPGEADRVLRKLLSVPQGSVTSLSRPALAWLRISSRLLSGSSLKWWYISASEQIVTSSSRRCGERPIACRRPLPCSLAA